MRLGVRWQTRESCRVLFGRRWPIRDGVAPGAGNEPRTVADHRAGAGSRAAFNRGRARRVGAPWWTELGRA